MDKRITRSGRIYCTPDIQHENNFRERTSKQKSARKKLMLFDPPNELSVRSLTDELILQEINHLSPLSSTKECKENVDPNSANCLSLSSPLRSLNLDSPVLKQCDTILQDCINVEIANNFLNHNHQKEISKSPRKRVLSERKNSHQSLQGKSSDDINSISVKNFPHNPNISSPSPSKKSKSVESSPFLSKLLDSDNENVTDLNTINDVSLKPRKWKALFSSNQSEKENIVSKLKNALHISIPHHLVGRDSEISCISTFIKERVTSHTAGSLYISGAPGTGKTACLTNVLCFAKVSHLIPKQITINCMTLRTSQKIYECIATEMGATRNKSKNYKLALKYVEEHLTADGPMILLFLDEMDQLDSKHQEVLYTMFGWSSLKNSRMILIGIANSLDLTDRILPRLRANLSCKPKLLNFKPYNKDQLLDILQARMLQVSTKEDKKSTVIDPMAMQFCARKVAALSGDARKALDVCRRALEIMEVNSVKHSEDAPLVSQKVGIRQISSVIFDVYKSSSICNRDSGNDSEDSFPLQQKLLVCTLILLCKKIRCKEASIGKLHETYAKICKKRLVPSVYQSEFVSLCDLVEARGIISLKKSKQIRQSKVKLNIQENDVEFAFQGKALLDSILQGDL